MLAVSRTIAAPAEAVWAVLVDLSVWPRWGPSVSRAELDPGEQIGRGATGRVWTPLGVALPFEISSFESGHSWAWRVAGIPATHHTVTPTDDGCVVTFGVPVWAPAYLAVCALAVRRIDRLVD